MQRLKYTEYKGCKDIITIDLHNNYTIIAIKSWNKEKENYSVELRITENTIDKWDLIPKAEFLEFNVNHKNINSAILKQVAIFLEEGFFDYFIHRCEYELKCFDKGNEFYESEKLSRSDA